MKCVLEAARYTDDSNDNIENDKDAAAAAEESDGFSIATIL